MGIRFRGLGFRGLGCRGLGFRGGVDSVAVMVHELSHHNGYI